MKITVKTALLSFASLAGASCLIIAVTDHFILTPRFYNNSGDLLGFDGSELATYANVQKYIYLIELIYLTVKLLLVTTLICTALYLSDIQVTFLTVFNVVILAEFVFIIAAVIKVIWFYNFYPAGTLADWHKTYLLSMLSLIPDVKAAWYYPLQTLNVFEVGYWFLLAFGLSLVTELDFDRSLQMIVKGYVPALVVWVACVVFLTLIFFPAQG